MMALERERRKKQIEQEKQRRLKKLGASLEKNALQQIWSEDRNKQKKLVDEHVDDIDDIEESKIREIFMDEGLIKKKDKEREQRLLYQGIKCEKSIYMFSKQNRFRLFCYKLQKHPVFDRFVMFLIEVFSLKLGIESYLVKM